MPLGTSLLLIAVGAILKFAVTANGDGFDINTIGVILMIVGAAGLLISLLFFNPWVDRGTTRTVIRERDREIL